MWSMGLGEQRLILAHAVEFGYASNGWIHLALQGYNPARGPLGLLLYLVFVPCYWIVPRAYRAPYLIATSLLLALATLGHGYAATIVILVSIGLGVVRIFATRQRLGLGLGILAALYGSLIVRPQPFWLPPVTHPLYFYLQWAGIGYIFLKTVHVLVDSATGKLAVPATGDFLAYLLFAPTLRMGPIYRFGDFSEQLHGNIRENRRIGAGFVRFVVGIVRLGTMLALLEQFPIEPFFEHPERLPNGEFILRLYLVPMTIYLWISGYIDLSVGLGRVMGFTVPENFNYPWRATSLAEFWRRWHITLGAWLRDYIYIPLGGNRRHVFFNYLLTFLFCGLWHGTYVSYVLWGLSQGIGLAIRRNWSLYWKQQREEQSPLYQRLTRARLVGTPGNDVLGWLITFHYQILTIAWFMDERYAGVNVARRMLGIMGLD